ncbi:hypothetical protein P6F26_02825 [Roseibacterium sp. SDUM158017]|uniref:hypothetical protein n=1 Tax=Roseicyclus salinarum TaxID=3036773 RepID=UPI00241533BD|nr:hypothetical protein [Roseibacterium sp. SDUM158017]MDG4647365.1 hypothetical protein [Roseibacterium sp. SDUM158017]
MKRILTTTAFALSLGSAVSAPAAAEPMSSLEECYNTVITWCTETFPEHASECGSSSGLDACDEVFGDRADARAVLLVTPGDPVARLRVLTSARPAPSQGDDDGDRGGDGDRNGRGDGGSNGGSNGGGGSQGGGNGGGSQGGGAGSASFGGAVARR